VNVGRMAQDSVAVEMFKISHVDDFLKGMITF
jgi:hypothetical protein